MTGGRRAGRLRLVRPGRAFPVVLEIRSDDGLADGLGDALRGAGFTVAE